MQRSEADAVLHGIISCKPGSICDGVLGLGLRLVTADCFKLLLGSLADCFTLRILGGSGWRATLGLITTDSFVLRVLAGGSALSLRPRRHGSPYMLLVADVGQAPPRHDSRGADTFRYRQAQRCAF